MKVICIREEQATEIIIPTHAEALSFSFSFFLSFLKLLILILIGANCIITKETIFKSSTQFISSIYLF